MNDPSHENTSFCLPMTSINFFMIKIFNFTRNQFTEISKCISSIPISFLDFIFENFDFRFENFVFHFENLIVIS
jgi:hypothetical protein